MFNKKTALFSGILILAVWAAAIVARNMLNRGVEPIVSDRLPGGPEFTFSSSNNITPAPELPVTRPELTGLYVERKDKVMTIQAFSFDPGIGGILGDSVDVNSAPQVEIIMTGKTTIYRDTTQLRQPSSGEINQTVEEATLVGLIPPTMISVWGRRSGDRIIAEVLLYSNSLNLQKP